MSYNPQRSYRGALTAALFLVALLAAGAASAAQTAVRVTAVAGAAEVGGAALEGSAALGEDASVQTGSDGNAAMLVDEDSVVELCASTIMNITRHADTGTRVIEVSAGTTRIIVDPRAAEEHIQIHTPAAIATILGTIVYVTVDPVTGETTITSEDSQVKVESSDPSVLGSTVISGSEQITIRPGEAPSQPKKLARTALSNMGGCLMNLHDVALSLTRVVSNQNIPLPHEPDLPPVGAPPPSGPPSGPDIGDPGGGDGPPCPPCTIPDDFFEPPEPPCTVPGGCGVVPKPGPEYDER